MSHRNETNEKQSQGPPRADRRAAGGRPVLRLLTQARARRGLWSFLGLAVALVAATGALGYFSTTGSGAATTSTGTLATPTFSSAAPGAGTVAISWAAASPPNGLGTVRYYVTRGGGAPAGTCPTASSPGTATSCTDSGLNAGTYSYTVTAVWQSWTSTSSPRSVSVSSGALDHFNLVALAAATAGSPFAVTVTAEDVNNNPDVYYRGTAHFTSSDAQAVLPSDYTFTAGDNGSHTFAGGVTLKTAGSQSVSTSDTVQTTVTGSATVTVSPATASSLSLAAASVTPTAGTSDNVTITAHDPYGNLATGYAGIKSLTFGGAHGTSLFAPTVSNSAGTALSFGLATPISFTAGVAGVTGGANGVMTLYKAETDSITVSDGSINNGAGLAVTVGPAAAASLSLSAASATPTAGATDALTITAVDAYGNTATGYAGSKNLTFAGAHSIGAYTPVVTNASATPISFGATTPITFTAGVASSSTGGATGQAVATLYAAETVGLSVSDGTINSTANPLAITVGPSSASSFRVPAPGSQTAGTPFSETISALDVYGNIALGYAGTKTVTFSGPGSAPSGKAPSYPATITFTAGVGIGSITLYDAQSTVLTAAQGAVTGASGSFTVGAAGAAAFSLSSPGSPTAGTAFSETITALDAYGNPATGYTGSQAVTFSGPAGSPNGTAPSYPGSVSFTAGVGSASITLSDAQTTTLTATQGSVSGSTASFTVSPGAAGSFTMPTPATQTAGTAFNVTLTAYDADGNRATGYGGSQPVSFTGPASSPNRTAPSYPAAVSFTGGVGTASITLYDAQSTALTATQGSVTGTSAGFTAVAAANHQIAAGAASPQAAGGAFNVTLTAQDAYGNAPGTLSGTKSVTFSGPANAPNGRTPAYPVSVTFSGGTATAPVTLYDAQSTQITAADTTDSYAGVASPSITVNAAAAATFSLPSPGSQTAGTAFSETITALDAYGNPATGYAGSQAVTFSGPASSPNGTAPSYPGSVSFTAGVGSASITLSDAQTTTLTATQGSVSGSTASFTVSAGAASSFTMPTPATQTAGTAFNVTLTATDADGNTAPGLTGSQAIVFSGPSSSPSGATPTYPASVSFSAGVGTAAITLVDAQATALTAALGSVTGTSGTFTVAAAAVSRVGFGGGSVSGASSSTANLGPITVQEQDTYGNPGSAGGSITVNLSSSPAGVFSSTQFGTNVTSVTLTSAQPSTSVYYGNSTVGTATITASATGYTSASQQATITKAPAGLGMTAASGNPTISCGSPSLSNTCNVSGVGSSGSVTFYVTFLDANGNPVVYSTTQSSTVTETGHDTGTVTVAAGASSSSPNSLTASHAGSSVKTSTLTFGPYTLTINVSS